MTRLVAIRCDAGPAIGGGHVMRCLALAAAFAARGRETLFIVSPETTACAPALARSRHRVIHAGPRLEELPRQIATLGVDVLVIDHLETTAAVERGCRAHARCLLVVDDMADRDHDCDALMNSGAGVDAKAYAGRVARECRLLLGPAFAALTVAFLERRAESLARRTAGADVRRVLVSFGATDPANATSLALAALRGRPDTEVDVALSAQAPHLGAVRAACDGVATLHLDSDAMAELATRADLALGACGNSAWERACLGLPTIAMTISDNQRAIAAALAAAGAAEILGPSDACTPHQIAHAVDRLVGDSGARRRMSAAAAALCDGRGATRVAEALCA
jgi:UDP-2,4-diacetamido-2,4,6-trideoxy-beta-L-altropyranose hydrolase